jgi:hypothetical protein
MKHIVFDILKSIFEENQIHMHALKSNILQSPYKISLNFKIK